MGSIPDAEQATLRRRLEEHAAENYSDVCQAVDVRFRGEHAYVTAVDPAGDEVKLCRLTWTGNPDEWQFAFYKYSTESYDPSMLPSGRPVGTPEECFECAAMYLQPME